MSDPDLAELAGCATGHPEGTAVVRRGELRWLVDRARDAERYEAVLGEVSRCKQCDVCPEVAGHFLTGKDSDQ